MRVVVDANVLVSAVISAAGPPREIVGAWVDGRFELVASPALLQELRDVLDRPTFRRWVSAQTAAAFADGLAEDALIVDDRQIRPLDECPGPRGRETEGACDARRKARHDRLLQRPIAANGQQAGPTAQTGMNPLETSRISPPPHRGRAAVETA